MYINVTKGGLIRAAVYKALLRSVDLPKAKAKISINARVFWSISKYDLSSVTGAVAPFEPS